MMKRMKTTVAAFLEDLFGTRGTTMLWAWLGAIVLVIAVGVYVGSDGISFLGIAESREININFERAVEIKVVHVQSGQRVAKGEVLLELDQSEIESQIRGVQAQIGKIDAELKLRESLSKIVSKKHVASNVVDPLRVEREQLVKEVGLLENQKRGLFVLSDIDGIVGSVNFKAGEKAPAFATLVTVSPINPSYVVGYVHESAHSKLVEGARVKIISPATGREAYGEVMTVGARIVEIPQRLLRIPTSTWGREVLIKMPAENGFLLSEKVQVKPTLTFDFMPAAQANDTRSSVNEELEVELPYEISIGEKFEPSGLVWAEDLNNFIVISDEAIQAGAPTLLLMNAQGQVSRQLLTIEGVAGLDDVESISADGTSLYVMASHSGTRKGNRSNERETFLKIDRKGLVVKAEASVNLRALLVAALATSADPRLIALAEAEKQGEFDIEGHAVEGGNLYLAFKSPMLDRNRGLVVLVKNVASVFKTNAIPSANVSVFAELNLRSTTKHVEMQLSDFHFKNGKGFIATTCVGDDCSALWSFAPGTNPLQLAFFPHSSLEGVTYDAKTNVVTGIFDNSGKPTKMVRIHLK